MSTLDAFAGSLFLYRKKDGTQVRAPMIQPRIAVWTRQQMRRAARAVEKAERQKAAARCQAAHKGNKCQRAEGHEGTHYLRNGSSVIQWSGRASERV